jgi:hypothetical protein
MRLLDSVRGNFVFDALTNPQRIQVLELMTKRYVQV